MTTTNGPRPSTRNTFVVFCNDAKSVHFSYRRYLENHFRRRWGFEGTAIRLEFRSRAE